MCVIAACIEQFPTDEMFKQMAEANPHGMGLAWVDKNRTHWQKGLWTMDEFFKLLAWIKKRNFIDQGPIVAHFRVSTNGGVREELCHPFSLDPDDPSTDVKGSSEHGVLFHNGHWTGWQKHLIQAGLASGMRLPSGPWIDSRAIAYYVAKLGSVVVPGLDGVLPDRVATLDPVNGLQRWGTWVEPKDKGYVLSNDNFERRGAWTKGSTKRDRDRDHESWHDRSRLGPVSSGAREAEGSDRRLGVTLYRAQDDENGGRLPNGRSFLHLGATDANDTAVAKILCELRDLKAKFARGDA